MSDSEFIISYLKSLNSKSLKELSFVHGRVEREIKARTKSAKDYTVKLENLCKTDHLTFHYQVEFNDGKIHCIGKLFGTQGLLMFKCQVESDCVTKGLNEVSKALMRAYKDSNFCEDEEYLPC